MSQRTPKPQHWRQWTEREARDVLARLDRSELSAAAFARSIGVSINRIRYWRTRLAATPQPAADARAQPQDVAVLRERAERETHGRRAHHRAYVQAARRRPSDVSALRGASTARGRT